MTHVKKVVAVMLAFLMIFSSASVLASAWDASNDDGFNLNIETKFFKQVGGEWVETTKVKPGDTVEARVYLGTDYYSNDSTLLFFYDKDFFTHSYTASPVRYAVDSENTVLNANNSFVTTNDVTVRVAANPSLTTQIDNGYIDSDFTNDYAAISAVVEVNADGESNVMYDGSDYILAFTLTVAENASGEGDFFVKDTTVQSAASKRALVNVPKGPADGTDADLWAMRLWDANVTLASQPVSTQSSVTFNANTGIFADGTETVLVEGAIDAKIAEIKEIPEVTKDGYAFMGWIDAADTTPTYEETISAPVTIPENDLVLNAYWMETVDITFDTDGGSNIPAIIGATPYAEFAEIANPTKDGYTFVGWDVRGNMDLPETYPDVDTTYTAIWAKDVVVSFDTNGADAIAPISGVAGEEFKDENGDYYKDIIDDPKKDGHYFIGWSPALPTVFPEQDTTYTANFEAYAYIVSYYVDGVLAAQTQVEYGMPIPTVVPIIEVTTGKILDGWYTDEDMTAALAAGTTMPVIDPADTDGYSLYAKTTNATYDAIFRVDGNVYATVPTEYEANILAPGDEDSTIAAPAKEGYVFAGWDPYPGTMDEANDMYFDAVWTEAMNTAIYVVDGGQYEKFEGIAYGMDLEVPSDPDKEGYTFLGWAETADATEAIQLPEKMPADSVTYYAVFKINTYTVTFNTGDGAFEDGETKAEVPYEYNADVEKPGVPVKTGYTFAAWVDDATGTEYAATAVLPKMIADDVSYTAKYTINSYKATFVSEGTTVEEKSYDYNTAVAKPATDPTKTGYTFVAWVGADGTEYDKDTALPAMGTADVTYTAKFTINTYTVTWVFDNGTTENQVDSYEYSKEVAMPSKPEKTGYTFAGWKYSVTDEIFADGAAVPAMAAEHVTYTAQWSINTYYVTWVYNDGVTADVKVPYEYNAEIQTPEKPDKKTGYTFVEWSPAVDKNMPAQDVTYTATWDANSYDAVFNANGGYFDNDTTVTSKTVPTDYDADIVAPAAPSMTGFVFNGWEPEVGKMNSTSGLTFTAKWINATDTKYTVVTHTMKADGTYEEKSEIFTGETNAPVDVTPANVENGFKFNAEKSTVTGNILADSSLVLDIYIDRESYAFTTIAGDETNTTNYLYGATVVMPAKVDKVGYTFNGWYDGDTKYAAGASTTMPLNGLTVEAKWDANTDTVYKVVVNYTDAATGVHAEETELTGTSDYAIVFVDEAPETEAENTIYLLKSDYAVNHYTLDEAASDLTGTVAPDGSTVLNLYYTPVKYVATFNTDIGAFEDGSKSATVELAYNTLVKPNAPADPVKEGYTFTGWSGLNDATRLTGNRTFTAQFTADPKTITWVIDTDNTQVQNYVTDAPVYAPADPVKTGYKFLGWSDKADQTTEDAKVEIPATMPAVDKTYYAIWEIQQYTVTFYQDKGSDTVVFTTTADYGTSFDVPTTTKEGHTFANWLDAATDTVVTFGATSTIPENGAEYYATWTVNNYTATWVFDNGDADKVETYAYNAVITKPADPSKAGYTFNGWSPEVASNMPASNVTYTAQWTPNEYTITFDADNGTEATTVTQAYKTSVAAPADPAKSGYSFKGWATTKGVTDPAQAVAFPVEMPIGGTTYYAIWVANNYTITFDSKDGTAVAPVTQAYGTSVAAPTAPTKEGHTFGGWSATDGGTTAVTFPVTMPVDGATYYAIWTVETYTVNWVNLGATAKSESVAYNAALTAPEVTRTGYTLEKWVDDKGNTAPATMNDIGDNGAAVTYTAVWTAKQYNAIFNANDGAWTDGDKTKTVPTYFDQPIVAPADPARAGYTFNGWEPTVGNMTEEGMTFNATWLANGGITYTVITYTMGTDGQYDAGVSKAYEGVTDATVNVKPATVAAGFKLNDTLSVYEGVVAADGSLTLKVYIDRETYQFNTSVTAGTTTEKVGYLYGSTVVVPAEETKTGYTFNGWYYGDTKYAAGSNFTMPANDVTLTGSFDINSYTVTWVFDNGTADKVETYVYNTAIVAPATPVKEGYTFTTWSPAVATNMPAENVTYTAQWSANDYTITFNTNGGNTIAPITQAYGSSVTAPADPTRTGFTFAGWYSPVSKEEGGSKVDVPATMPLNGMTLVADWTRNSYTVTFYEDATKAKVLQQTSNQYEAAISAPVATIEGYELEGWYNAATNEKIDFSTTVTTPANDLEIYAKWTIQDFTVNFRGNGGLYADNKNLKTIEVTYGEAVVAPEIPVRAGYTFTGWKDNATGMVYAEGATLPVMIAETVNYVAQWQQETYTVSWISDGQVVTGDEFVTSAKHGDEIASPEMTKKGYTFNGWSYNGTTYPAGEMFTIVDAGENGAAITITADWTANQYDAIFNANGGAWTDGDKTKTVPTYFDQPIVAPADPARAGYTFNGWEPTVGNMTEEGMTFNAAWLANGGITYTVITYTMGTDGKYDEGVSKTYEGVTDATVNVKPATVADGFKLNDTLSVYEGTVTADGKLTLKVYIDRESYEVTTKVDGEVKSTATVLYGAEVTVPALEVKEGYTFSGWSVNGTAYEANATFAMPAEAVEISGTFTVNQYDAKFYVDGALIATVPTNYGEVPVAPTATKTGYTFKEWSPALAAMTVNGAEYNAVFTANTTTPYTVEIYTMGLDGVYGTPETESFTGTSDTTATYVPETKEGFTAETVSGNIEADGSLVLKVYYERQKFSVTYNVDGSEYNTKEYYYGADVDATLAEPTKTGYTFSGWDAQAPATMPAEEVVINGTFSINTYTITYMVDGAEHKVESYEYGAAISGTLAEPTKTGYTFSGWDAAAPATMPAENLVISGTFSINTYTITYMVDGAEHKVESYTYGADVTALAAPTKEGYTFSGWDAQAPATMPANNLVISGTFTVNQYDATFYVDGALVATVPTNFGEVPAAPDVTTLKPGYTFVEWSPALEAMTTAGKRYDAVYSANGGIVYKVETYMMDTEGNYPDSPATTEEFTGIAGDTATYGVKTYEGFTFVSGTNYDADANTVSGTINGDGTTVLEVRYSRNKITVDINGDKDDYYYGEEIEEPTAPEEPEGMDHTGWVDEDGNEVDFPYTVPTDENDEIIITPVFTPINYTATFISEGATVEEKTVAYGSAINAPATPAKEGYRFVAWADENGTFLKSGETTMPAKDVTYTAVFEVTTSGVNYYVDGVLVGVVSCEYGDVISTTVPGYTVPTGYTFDGWYTNADCTVAFVEGTTYGSGVTDLYAKTTVNSYNAVFNANGGQFADGTDTYTVSVPYESNITAPADPVREGYDFLGWDPYVGTMDEEGMTFNAIWLETVDGYTVTYIVDNETYDTFDVALNADLEVPADPDKEGYTFEGWATTPDATADEVVDLTNAKMPANDLTYYAVFTIHTHTVNFYNYEAEVASPWKSADPVVIHTHDYDYDEIIAFPADPTNIDSAYWTFVGWSTEEDGEVIADTSAVKMIDADVNYYAVYEKVAVKLVPTEGSTTMIERNGAIESYNDGYTVSADPVEAADGETFDKYLIYGLSVGLRDTALATETSTVWVEVQGDGYTTVTPVTRGRLGTGTVVAVYDRNGTADTADDILVEQFYVVIFGDLDGNARLTAGDATLLKGEIANPVWSGRTRTEYLFRAANLDGNRRITSGDTTKLLNALSGSTIDQVTGTVS